MWPALSPYLTMAGRCWLGVHRPRDSHRICSQRGGWYANNLGKINFSAKFVLSCLPQDNLVTKKGNFPSLYLGRGIPKTIFYCSGQGCRIISDLPESPSAYNRYIFQAVLPFLIGMEINELFWLSKEKRSLGAYSSWVDSLIYLFRRNIDNMHL